MKAASSTQRIFSLAYWFTKYVVGRGAFNGLGMSGGGERFRVLARLNLGRDQMVLLVQAGERFFLLGVTAGAISNLAEYTREEAEAWIVGIVQHEALEGHHRPVQELFLADFFLLVGLQGLGVDLLKHRLRTARAAQLWRSAADRAPTEEAEVSRDAHRRFD